MDAITKQIRRIIKLHTDSAAYYRICASITTEDDLVELFNSLSGQRQKMAEALSAMSPAQTDWELWLLKDVLSYLQPAWYHMKLALIINDRKQILQYSLKNEQCMLQEYEGAANGVNLPEALFRQGIHHQQLLKENLRLIGDTTTVKYSRQKTMQYVMQQRE